jgi:PTH1 family peptidyl-tRNA hydrolase
MNGDNKKFLIVGLGNAEKKYAGTRHNIGFEVISHFAEKMGVTFRSDRYAYIAETSFKGRTLILAMPTTYMNLSGKAVHYWLEAEKIPVENLLVISDDIDLSPGTLRLRMKGSGGSHNGLNHIIEVLGHSNYPRLRFGIGKNYPQGYQIDYVLGKFENEELKDLIVPSIEKAATVIKDFVTIGIQKTMNQCNQS